MKENHNNGSVATDFWSLFIRLISFFFVKSRYSFCLIEFLVNKKIMIQDFIIYFCILTIHVHVLQQSGRVPFSFHINYERVGCLVGAR